MTDRTIVVGDVHGCRQELCMLVQALKLTKEDHLVFVGDLVDKGPESAGVVRYARSLKESGFHVSLVLGNHEESHLRWLSKEEGKQHVMKKHAEISAIQKQLSPADVAFLRNHDLILPLPELGAVVVHAGLSEFMQELPTRETLAASSNRKKKKLLQACRLRYVTDEGHFVSLNDTDLEKHTFWAERYDGRFGHAYYGHEATTELRKDKHATSLDLGCVYGGKLAAAVLVPGEDPEIVTVDALDTYCDPRLIQVEAKQQAYQPASLILK